jgi:L-cysteine:1D-myo-inositol 2-amino-2-deoxy-alpha-D-glucopyranoside ligase
MTFEDLEQRAHGELSRLPLPMAPPSLLPRVLAAVDAWAGDALDRRGTDAGAPVLVRAATDALLGVTL